MSNSRPQTHLNSHLMYRQHIVRGSKKERLKSKLYIFNSFGMLGTYVGTEPDYRLLIMVKASISLSRL